MPLTRRHLAAAVLLLASGCLSRIAPPFSRIPVPAPRLVQPSMASNMVLNGGFEEARGDDPAEWQIFGRDIAGARIRSVALPGAPEGKRVAEASLAPGGGEVDYGLFFLQDVRVKPWTTYDLSVWVRGIDLVSGVGAPHGSGQHCGLFFWLLGPDGDPAVRLFPSGAFPRKDGTTGWELRKMRFTIPPADIFPPPAKGNDDRFILSLQVLLFGTGTVQVDDLRLAPSTASPPPPYRGPGRLALAQRGTKPFFGLGLHWLPTGLTWRDVALERIFNFNTSGGTLTEKAALGVQSFLGANMLNPSCRGCGSPSASDCPTCRSCPDLKEWCDGYNSEYLYPPGLLGVWADEANSAPEVQGDLDDFIRATRRIKKNAGRFLAPGQALYIYDSDAPAGTYFNTYGWDDLALSHASEAFDIVGSLRRGGNQKRGYVGGLMSEFRETSINGIRQSTRRVADDVTSADGVQGKPVWMIVNGGSGRILTDRTNLYYPTAPHDAAELLASRPSLPQLRYMLFAAILNGATGLHFYQDGTDTILTPEDPFWKKVLIPAGAELATLERETGFLTQAEYNQLGYRLTGDAEAVDSMLKQSGQAWILAVANSSPEAVTGSEFVLEGGIEIAGPPDRLVYRHDARPSRRRFEAVPTGKGGTDRFPLELPGYGVALYRFRLKA